MASLTICHSTSSGTSGVAKGFTTRKQTSVNGSFLNSSSSSAECRAISAGMYSPPSGAKPRNTAPRNEVSGAFLDVLRYLKEFHSTVFSAGPRALALDHFQKRVGIHCPIAQRRNLQRAVGQRFVTSAPRFDQRRIAPRHRFPRRLPLLRLKRATPQHRLRVAQISFNQQLLFLRCRRQIHNRHLPSQTH